MRVKILRITKISLVLLALLSITPLSVKAADNTLHHSFAGIYRIDPDHSLAWFTIEHARVAIYVGRFDKMTGHYTFDPGNSAKDQVAITIPVKSLDTNFAMRDHDLLGPDFFNAREFPVIKFTSTKYKPTGKHTGALYGKLTMHGITHTVEFHIRQIGAGPVKALPKPWGGYLSGYTATATIQRSDYDISAYEGMIGDTVHLHINIEGVRTQKL